MCEWISLSSDSRPEDLDNVLVVNEQPNGKRVVYAAQYMLAPDGGDHWFLYGACKSEKPHKIIFWCNYPLPSKEMIDIEFTIRKDKKTVTNINETVNVELADGVWHVKGALPAWQGVDFVKDVAVLNYIKCRLGHYDSNG